MRDFNCHEIDHNRVERLGFPEIVYGEFKTVPQLTEIFNEHLSLKKNIFTTRLQLEKAGLLLKEFSGGVYDELASTFTILVNDIEKRPGSVAVISAGTSDSSVVKEAVNTLKFLGVNPIHFNDIGVAGIHRLMDKKNEIEKCDVIIAVAGFEGALPSVVGGLFSKPIVAVPTSVGYGVAKGGETALHAMLTSCSNGILVTNIDNGCGAALGALRILNSINRR